jgi:hypothetical protein
MLNILYFLSAEDRGSVGEKFFEGIINALYLTKLKKRLFDTMEHFEKKGESDIHDDKPITDERRVFYLNTAKYVCMHVYMYACIYVCVCVCARARVCVCVRARVCVCMFGRVYVCMY